MIEKDDTMEKFDEKPEKTADGSDDPGAGDGINIGSATSNDGLEADVRLSNADSKWEDILGSNELLRQVLKAGTDDRKPQSGDLVSIRVAGRLEYGQTVDSHECLTFLLGHSEVIPAFDLCVSFMVIGEIDSVRTTARFAYGKIGKDGEIPPDASVTYEIELLVIEDGPNFEELSSDERMNWMEKKKQRGNYYFQRDEFTSAIDVYDRALKLLEPKAGDSGDDNSRLMEARATLYNNLAAAQLKVEAWNAAIKSLRQCLLVQPENVKAHFRTGKAYMGQGDYENAVLKMKDALSFDPDNKIIQSELTRASLLLKSENEKSRAVYKRMFAKPLSESGTKTNSIIGWLKEKCTITNGAVITVAGVAVAFVYRYFSEPRV